MVTGIYYTCLMHHQVHKDKPGNCPICGMKLTEIVPSGKTDTMSLDAALSYLTEPVTQTVVGSFKVIEPVETDPSYTVTADGTIGFDQRDINMINTRVTGRIEKLYVRYTNQRIHKGEPLMEIYSPELLSVQKNLLQATQEKDQTLIHSLKAQLLNLGMQNTEIQKLMHSGQPLLRIIIYSHYDGISQQTSSGSLGMMMRTSYSAGSATELLNIRKGMYVYRGQTVFAIQNTTRTWAILNVFTSDVWHLQPGMAVNLYTDAEPTHIVKGRVNFIPPYRSQGEKTTRIRIYLNPLPANWKIGMLIHGEVTITGQSEGVYVPLSAVNRLGMQSVAWVQDKRYINVFHARKVKTGVETGDSIQIIAGIQHGEKIVEDAGYMVGNDSFIQ